MLAGFKRPVTRGRGLHGQQRLRCERILRPSCALRFGTLAHGPVQWLLGTAGVGCFWGCFPATARLGIRTWDFVSLRTPGSRSCAGEQKPAGPVPSPVPEDTQPVLSKTRHLRKQGPRSPCGSHLLACCPQRLPLSIVGGHGALGPALPGAILCVHVATRQNTGHLCGPGQAGPSRPPTVPPGSHGCLEDPGRGWPRAHGGGPARGPCVLQFSLLGGLCVLGTLNYSGS